MCCIFAKKLAPLSVLLEVDTVPGQIKRVALSQNVGEETDFVFCRVSLAEWGISELKTCLPCEFQPCLLPSLDIGLGPGGREMTWH